MQKHSSLHCQTSVSITRQRRRLYIATNCLTKNLLFNTVNVKDRCAYSKILQHWILSHSCNKCKHTILPASKGLIQQNSYCCRKARFEKCIKNVRSFVSAVGGEISLSVREFKAYQTTSHEVMNSVY